MRRDGRIGLYVVYAAAVAMALGAAQPPARAEGGVPYAYGWPIQAADGASAYVLELPAQAYQWALPDAGLGDVVIVDAKGREVASGPYRPGAPVSHPVTLDVPLLAVPHVSDGTAGPSIRRSTNGDILIEPGAAATSGAPREWLVDARSAMAPERLEFPAPDGDMKLTVDIAGSRDLQDWTTLVQSASVVKLGQGEGAVDARVVKLAGRAMRYYRVRVTGGAAPWGNGDTTVTLSGSVVDAAARDVAKRQWLPVSSAPGATTGQGVDYDYVLPGALPVSGVRVKLGKGDSVARLDVIAVDGPVSGESLGTVVVTPGAGGEYPLNVSPTRRTLIRLHSATPLRSAPALTVGWRPDRFVFLPEGDAPYRLQVGSVTERRAAWPIQDAMDALRAKNGPAWRPESVTLGPGQELGGRKALDPASAPFDWTRPLLWVVLVLGAALVLGMAATLLRKPPPPGPEPH